MQEDAGASEHRRLEEGERGHSEQEGPDDREERNPHAHEREERRSRVATDRRLALTADVPRSAGDDEAHEARPEIVSVDLLVASDDHPLASIRDLRESHFLRARSRSPSRVRAGPRGGASLARTSAVALAISSTACSNA